MPVAFYTSSRQYVLVSSDRPAAVYTLAAAAPEYVQGHTHCTFRYDWVRVPEKLLATCDCGTDVQLELSDQKLVIVRPRRRDEFLLRNIRQVQLSFRRLLFPMVVGGIFAPLGVVAYFYRYMATWPGLAMVIVSIMLFVYGLRGTCQVSVHHHSAVVNLFADEEHPRLRQLVELANQYAAQAREPWKGRWRRRLPPPETVSV